MKPKSRIDFQRSKSESAFDGFARRKAATVAGKRIPLRDITSVLSTLNEKVVVKRKGNKRQYVARYWGPQRTQYHEAYHVRQAVFRHEMKLPFNPDGILAHLEERIFFEKGTTYHFDQNKKEIREKRHLWEPKQQPTFENLLLKLKTIPELRKKDWIYAFNNYLIATASNEFPTHYAAVRAFVKMYKDPKMRRGLKQLDAISASKVSGFPDDRQQVLVNKVLRNYNRMVLFLQKEAKK